MYKRCLLFLLVILFCFSGCNTATKNQLNDLTLQQKYSVLEDRENWYFSSEGDGIYSVNKSTGKKSLIYKAEVLDTSYLHDEWIYFVDANWDICRVKTSGEDHTVLLNAKQFWEYEEQPIEKLFVAQNKLLIQLTFPLYCYDMDSKEIVKISDDARNFEAVGEKVYYCGRDASIYVFDMYTEQSEILLAGDLPPGSDKRLYKNFVFVEGEMYYYMRQPDGLYCYCNGSNISISNDTKINEFSLLSYGEKLYFVIRGEDNDRLMQYDPAEKSLTEVLRCSDFVRGAKIVDGYFYYLDSASEIREVKIL